TCRRSGVSCRATILRPPERGPSNSKGAAHEHPSAEACPRESEGPPQGRPRRRAASARTGGGAHRRGPPDGGVLAVRAHRRVGRGGERLGEFPGRRRPAHGGGAAAVPPGAGEPLHRRLGTVLSVHNAGFQGHFPPETMTALGLPGELYNPQVFEWYGRMNILKGGLTFSDLAVTVSPTHARELLTPEGGFGLQ